MEDGLTPPLIFVHQKGLTKLELKVHVIQTLIKPLLLILHEAGFLVPPFMSINHSYTSKSGLQIVWGFVIPPLNLGVFPPINHLEKSDRDLCSAFQLFDTDPLPCCWPFWTEFVGIGHSCSVLFGSECASGQATSPSTAQHLEGCRKALTGNTRTPSRRKVFSLFIDLSTVATGLGGQRRPESRWMAFFSTLTRVRSREGGVWGR